MKLHTDFYQKDALCVAKKLLGKVLVRKISTDILRARIVEVEAYTGKLDQASHSYNGRKTKRTSVMYREGGCLYVYLIYGLHNLMNIVTGTKDNGEAVLIRAVQPLNNFDVIAYNRFGKLYKDLSSYQRKNLTNGPGKLTQALGIDMRQNGVLLSGEEIFLEDDGYTDFQTVAAKRIGIDYAKQARDFLYRFYIAENKYVSVK